MTTYTQGYTSSVLKSHQSRTAAVQAAHVLPYITSSSHILDIGCGPGTITCDFAFLATQGQVIGADFSDEVLATARAEAERRGGLGNLTFQVADAKNLPFDDDTFDVVHCHALLVHVPNASAVVKEMHRVCKTGGCVACREPDWDTMVIYPLSASLAQWQRAQRELNVTVGSEPNTGRHLASWALAAGFDGINVRVTTDVLQYFGREEVKWWGEAYAERVTGDFGKRAVESGLLTREEIERISEAWREWSRGADGALFALMHMRLLAQKW